MRALVGIALGVAGGAAWLITQGHRDPRLWPQAAGEEAARLRAQLSEAAAAGKRAAREEERAIEKELADAEAGRNRLT